MFRWSLSGITLNVVCDIIRHVVYGITLHVILFCDVSLVPLLVLLLMWSLYKVFFLCYLCGMHLLYLGVRYV